MESIFAQVSLASSRPRQSRPVTGNLRGFLVCQTAVTGSKKGARLERAKRKSLRPKVSGIETMETAAAGPSPVGLTIKYHGMHHVGLLCKNLEQSLDFYQGILGMGINTDRPNKKLPYRGAWLWIGSEMIHLMELPNPDPMENRPEHGGRDRHICIAVGNLTPLVEALDQADVQYTMSMSGRRAVFFRDPDMNCLECVEVPS